jgi:hypothetical protein
MPSLFSRFARARNATGNDDPYSRPKTSAEELATPAIAEPDDALRPEPDKTDGDLSADSLAVAQQVQSSSNEDHKTTDPDEVRVEPEDDLIAGESEEQRVVDPAAAAAAAAQLKKANQKAKAAAALKNMKARSGFSLWRWLPTFYDPVEDTVRSRIIAVLAVALIPAMLTGLLLEPMITDVAAVTQNKAMVFSPLFLPMDPMYAGVLPARGYEFRFVVRNAKHWPISGT